jgi:hypothetical protein
MDEHGMFADAVMVRASDQNVSKAGPLVVDQVDIRIIGHDIGEREFFVWHLGKVDGLMESCHQKPRRRGPPGPQDDRSVHRGEQAKASDGDGSHGRLPKPIRPKWHGGLTTTKLGG